MTSTATPAATRPIQQSDCTLDRDAEAGGERGGGDQRRGGQHVDVSGGIRVASSPGGHGSRGEPSVFKIHIIPVSVDVCLLPPSTAVQMAGAPSPLRRNPRRLNCPFRIRSSSSIPAIVAAAVLNLLNPSIGSMRDTAVILLDEVVQIFR